LSGQRSGAEAAFQRGERNSLKTINVVGEHFICFRGKSCVFKFIRLSVDVAKVTFNKRLRNLIFITSGNVDLFKISNFLNILPSFAQYNVENGKRSHRIGKFNILSANKIPFRGNQKNIRVGLSGRHNVDSGLFTKKIRSISGLSRRRSSILMFSYKASYFQSLPKCSAF